MKVSWDYEIPHIWKVIKLMSQTTNQLCCQQKKGKHQEPQLD